MSPSYEFVLFLSSIIISRGTFIRENKYLGCLFKEEVKLWIEFATPFVDHPPHRGGSMFLFSSEQAMNIRNIYHYMFYVFFPQKSEIF